jgi:hypothetical protein
MMGNMIKAIRYKAKGGQRGYVYILVLVFMMVGALMIPPILEFMGTGVWSNPIFEQKTDEIYACDAGIDDAIWQIKYENIHTMFATYDEYDYDNNWSYSLVEDLNDESVSVDIQNRWIPKDITPLTPTEMRNIIEGTDPEVGSRIRVNGSATAFSEYRIRIDIIPEHDEWDLRVESIGIWIPSGFSYVDGSSNLEDPMAPYHSNPVVSKYAGGEIVVWNFGLLPFDQLPPAGSQETAIVEFEYTSETAREMVTVSWIDTQNLGGGEQIPFSWDDDTKVFGITSSSSGGTTVESNIYLSSRYSSLLDNAITSPAATDIQPSTTINGIISCPADGFGDEPDSGDWEWQDYDEEWPVTEDWRDFYLLDVTGAPDPLTPVDAKDYGEDIPMGPWLRNGYLNIRNTGNDTGTVPLGGTVYVAGDLDFAQTGTPKMYTINLNRQTIFVEGDIYFAPGNITLTGTGCIVAIGDINFQPNITSNPGDFIFVCSLEGTVNFNPNGDYTGSVAGQEIVGTQPGTSITWRPPPGSLNLPDMGGGGTGSFGGNVTKYTWKID